MSEHNAIAKKIMEASGVRINHLNAYVTPQLGKLQKPKDLH